MLTGTSGGMVEVGTLAATDCVNGSAPSDAVRSRKISPAPACLLPPPPLAATAMMTMTTTTATAPRSRARWFTRGPDGGPGGGPAGGGPGGGPAGGSDGGPRLIATPFSTGHKTYSFTDDGGTARRYDSAGTKGGKPMAASTSGTAGFHPDRRVPPRGVPTWPEPDPSLPKGERLAAGTSVEVLEELPDGWARVRREDGWTAWLDGRRLR